MSYRYRLSDFGMAKQALAIARRIQPNTHFYITNEFGPQWHIVEGYNVENTTVLWRNKNG